jgi:hypothetical protein
MALATYADLQDSIQDKFDDTASLSDSVVADCITMGEALINEDPRLRGREMESVATDITISSQSTNLPTGYLGMRRLYLDKTPDKPLVFFPPADFWGRTGTSQTGVPSFYTIEAGTIVVAPVPTSAETGKILYYVKSNIISSVPALFTGHPHIYVYAASIFAADHLDDDAQVAKNAAMFDQFADKYAAGTKLDRFPKGQLIQRNDVNPNFREDRTYAA